MPSMGRGILLMPRGYDHGSPFALLGNESPVLLSEGLLRELRRARAKLLDS